jgi:hypothetical protein
LLDVRLRLVVTEAIEGNMSPLGGQALLSPTRHRQAIRVLRLWTSSVAGCAFPIRRRFLGRALPNPRLSQFDSLIKD